MSQPIIQTTRPLAEGSLADLLDQVKREIMLSLNCHAIGTIQSFDAEKQTATVTINYQRTLYKAFQKVEKDSQTREEYRPFVVDYPPLVDCPVICLGGGEASLRFPIKQGDECLVLFNDRDIDNWFAGAPSGPVASLRTHSFADALVLVGVRSLGNVLPGYEENEAQLKWGADGPVVGVNADKVRIAKALVTLNGLMSELIDAIKAITINPSGIIAPNGGGPCSGSGTVSGASQTALDNVANDFGDLLE